MKKIQFFTMNKSGATPSQIIIDAWSTIVIIVIIALFFFILMVAFEERNVVIQSKIGNIDANNQLLYLLDIPVVYDNRKMAFAEAIATADNRFDQAELEKLYQQYIVPAFYPECVQLHYQCEGNTNNCDPINTKSISKIDCGEKKGVAADAVYSAATKIPTTDENRNLIVSFSITHGYKFSSEMYTLMLCDNAEEENTPPKLECVRVEKNKYCKKKFYEMYNSINEAYCNAEKNQ